MIYLTGKQLQSLMLQHKVTIAVLAARLQLPMTRVRLYRAHGHGCPFTARDWIQAITGTDPGPISRLVTAAEFLRLPPR